MTKKPTMTQLFTTQCYHCGKTIYVDVSFSQDLEKPCEHEWHADQDNQCNFCVKCGARQEIYIE